MDPIVKYETNSPCVNVRLHEIDIPHNIVEVGEIPQRDANGADGLSIDHVDLVGAAILLERQRLENGLRLLEVLPACAGIAVAARANVDVLGGGGGLDLVIPDVTPIGAEEVHRENASLHVLVVGLVLAVDLHHGASISAGEGD